jgi:acyl-[acyl-carrier-protein]-phospholipid O-acyltransferase/long-chain-fatty-acid--[acyl-carrier-protein] ligase
MPLDPTVRRPPCLAFRTLGYGGSGTGGRDTGTPRAQMPVARGQSPWPFVVPPMTSPILRSRRFLPLFLTQCLGALNDNMFKTALAVMVIFQAGAHGPVLAAATAGIFILPFAVFSAVAGDLADSYDKARLILITKGFEVALMALAAIGFALSNVPVLMVVLFGMGVHATFFSPLKYGILPDHLAEHELVRGNGLIEAGTFGGILLGTVAGSSLIAPGGHVVGVAGMCVALAGLVTAAFVPKAPAQAAHRWVSGSAWNVGRQTVSLLRLARGNRDIWLCIVGLSWFWTLGACFITEFPALAARDFGAGSQVVTLMLACFAVGVGVGSVLAGRLLAGDVSARLAPFAIAGMSVFGFIFCRCVWHVTPQAGGGGGPSDIRAGHAGVVWRGRQRRRVFGAADGDDTGAGGAGVSCAHGGGK